MNTYKLTMREVILYFSLKYQGDFFRIYQAIQRKEATNADELKEMMDKIEGWNCVTIFDDDYPERLKLASCPPFVLWYKGDLSVLNKKIVAVGTGDENHLSPYAIRMLKQIETDVTSCDHAVIATAKISNYLTEFNTIKVLDCGIDEYTDDLDNHVLIVGEYPCAEKFDSKWAEQRLVVGLSDKFVLLESNTKDGVKNYVEAVLSSEANIGFFCVPDKNTSNGKNICNTLISLGAGCYSDYKYIDSCY